jgi:hypothetical protein
MSGMKSTTLYGEILGQTSRNKYHHNPLIGLEDDGKLTDFQRRTECKQHHVPNETESA